MCANDHSVDAGVTNAVTITAQNGPYAYTYDVAVPSERMRRMACSRSVRCVRQHTAKGIARSTYTPRACAAAAGRPLERRCSVSRRRKFAIWYGVTSARHQRLHHQSVKAVDKAKRRSFSRGEASGAVGGGFVDGWPDAEVDGPGDSAGG